MDSGNKPEHFVSEYSDYVVKIAKQVKRTLHASVETQDLIAYGMTGLLEAAGRFDPSLGVSFSTFSYYRIRGAIYDGLRKMGSLSKNEYKNFVFQRNCSELLQEKQSQTYAKNLSHVSSSNISRKIKYLACIYITSLDAGHCSNLKDDSLEDSEERVARIQLYEKMRMAIGYLPDSDQKIINHYYFEELSLEEVGKKLGLSKSWTSRKHARVIERLSMIFFELIKEKSSQENIKN